MSQGQRLNVCDECGHYSWSHIKEQINQYITRIECCVKNCICKTDEDIRLAVMEKHEFN